MYLFYTNGAKIFHMIFPRKKSEKKKKVWKKVGIQNKNQVSQHKTSHHKSLTPGMFIVYYLKNKYLHQFQSYVSTFTYKRKMLCQLFSEQKLNIKIFHKGVKKDVGIIFTWYYFLLGCWTEFIIRLSTNSLPKKGLLSNLTAEIWEDFFLCMKFLDGFLTVSQSRAQSSGTTRCIDVLKGKPNIKRNSGISKMKYTEISRKVYIKCYLFLSKIFFFYLIEDLFLEIFFSCLWYKISTLFSTGAIS